MDSLATNVLATVGVEGDKSQLLDNFVHDTESRLLPILEPIRDEVIRDIQTIRESPLGREVEGRIGVGGREVEGAWGNTRDALPFNIEEIPQRVRG